MAQGKATSAEEKAKVLAYKIEYPDASTRDIEEKTGVDHSTVANILESDLRQLSTKSERIARIIDNDMETVEAMSEIAKTYANGLKAKAKAEGKIDKAEMLAANAVTADSFKRAQLLDGKPTERV